MSVVTEYLTKIIQKNLDESGIVIWYDPKESYRAFIENLPIDVPVLTFQGSYFELRHQLESYLEGRDRKKVLVYIPADHNESASPLIEAEYWGTVLKPGGPTGKNTRLEIIARNALADIFNAEEIANLEKSIQQGTLTLEDLNTLSDTHQETGKAGSLGLIFTSTAPVDIILNFLSDQNYDAKIEEKKAFVEFRSFVTAHTGFESDISEFQLYRRDLSRYILISDFFASVKEPTQFSELDKITRSHKKGHTEFCKNCVKEWQVRRDLQEAYIETAETVESAFGLSSLEIPIKENITFDIYPFFEKRVSDYCIDLIKNENFNEAQKIIDTRKHLFWAEVDYRNTRLLWNILTLATDLNRISKKIISSLKGSGKLSPEKIIEKYTDLSNPDAWFRLDLLNRHFERAYSDYDDPPSEEGSPIALLVLKSRNTYSETINLLAEFYSDILVKNKFSYEGILSQREIFSKILSPKLTEGKTVYFLIDALRYEMGVDLFQSLDFKHKKIQAAIATPPTITPVGMAALLPEAHASFGIQISGNPSIGVQIDDSILKTREDRINYLRKKAPGKIVVIKLDETQKISKSTEKKLKNADLIVVTTQEIDDFSTYKDNKDLVRHIMSIILGQIKRSINNLVQMGCRNFVITADHGHIFGDSIGSEKRINPPGGETLYLDRRSWIGKGGELQESYMRVEPEVFGIDGDFDYAFPKGIACFKAKGDLVFFHGGLSLQESIIPVIEVISDIKKEKSPEKGLKFTISSPKEKITNRFFSVEVQFGWKEVLIGPEQYTVRIEFIVDGQEGKTVSASCGLNENTGEIILKRNEPCHITLMLPEGISQSITTIYLIDADTSKELSKIENLKISLSL